MTVSDSTQRTVEVAGVYNLRDLGGLVGLGGRLVRRGRVYRSDFPGFSLDDEAVTKLGLRSVVDLRHHGEVDSECPPWAAYGVEHAVWTLAAGKTDSWHARYPAYLTHRPDTVVGAVRTVVNPASQPVLFHCAAGKDRTGVVAALVLSILGVAADDIVADYLITDEVVVSILARLRTVAPYAEMLAGDTDDDQRPQAGAMASFLEWLAERGGADAWLLDHGVPADELDTARATLLEAPDTQEA
jgi:protein-tyrosine phosphatase